MASETTIEIKPVNITGYLFSGDLNITKENISKTKIDPSALTEVQKRDVISSYLQGNIEFKEPPISLITAYLEDLNIKTEGKIISFYNGLVTTVELEEQASAKY